MWKEGTDAPSSSLCRAWRLPRNDDEGKTGSAGSAGSGRGRTRFRNRHPASGFGPPFGGFGTDNPPCPQPRASRAPSPAPAPVQPTPSTSPAVRQQQRRWSISPPCGSRVGWLPRCASWPWAAAYRRRPSPYGFSPLCALVGNCQQRLGSLAGARVQIGRHRLHSWPARPEYNGSRRSRNRRADVL